MEDLLSSVRSMDLDLTLLIKAVLILSAGYLLLGGVGRLLSSQRSNLEHSISSAFGIVFIYAVTVVLYSLGAQYRSFTAPLPFIEIKEDAMFIFSFQDASYEVICSQILSMVVLAFLVNIIDSILPEGERLVDWFALRCLTVILAMALHLLVSGLLTRYLPGMITNYAAAILLGTLVVLLMVSVLKLLVGIVLSTVHPLIGAFYTFFFATLVGKALTKAMLTTLLLALLVYVLNMTGVTVLPIASAELTAYLPFLAVLVVLWYFITRILLR